MNTKQIKSSIKRQFNPAKARYKMRSMLAVRKLKDDHLKTQEEARESFFDHYDGELMEDIRAIKLSSLDY